MAEINEESFLRRVAEVVRDSVKSIKIERKYMRIKTAAVVYDWEERTLREKCVRKEIPGATKPEGGKEWWIPVASMDALMESGVRMRRSKQRA